MEPIKTVQPVEIKFKQINLKTGHVEILTHSEKETTNYNRALHEANTENIAKQLDWLIARWNRMCPTHWRYELAE